MRFMAGTALVRATTQHLPGALARQPGMLLGGGMPARKPLRVAAQVGADQLQFGRGQAIHLQFLDIASTAFRLLQSQGQALQNASIEAAPIRWLFVHLDYLVVPLKTA